MLNKNIMRLYIIFIVSALVMSVSVILIERIFFHESTQKVALDNGIQKVKEREKNFNTFLQTAENTLFALRNSAFFTNYLNDPTKTQDLENLFKACANSAGEFMQLRYIDKNGNEKIRIDRTSFGAKPILISKEKLQNKADRYYFQESKIYPSEQVWFSELDLNIENGKVEVPYKPTIRAILPLNKDGAFDGILIINYFMKEFLESFNSATLYDSILFNNKGYFIHHYNEEKAWSFYALKQATIMEEFPQYGTKLLQEDFLRTDTFVLKKLNVNVEGGLHLMLQLNKKYLLEEHQNDKERYMLLIAFVIVLPLLLTYIFVKFFGKTLLNLDELKSLNLELANNQEELKKSRDQLALIFEKAEEGIALLDLETRYIKVNPKYAELLGYTQKELIAKSCMDVTHQEHRHKMKDVYEIVLKKGSYENFQRECITKSGELKILSSSIVLLPNKQQLLVTTVDQTQLIKAMDKIQKQAYTDDLTALSNRKAYNEQIEELFATYKRYGTIFSIIIFDIDFFKVVNDTYGHQSGDELLQRFAKLLNSSARTNDFIFRIGGEEFAMLLPHTKKKDAVFVAEKIRKNVEENLCLIQNRVITISAGVAEIQKTDTIDSVYKRADDNLYYSKENGRNCVSSHL